MKRIFVTVLALGLWAGTVRAEDKASLRLNWLLYGFHTPFFLGVEQGLYK
jgi:NitT/TauT family transport system substrate-binding protein